MPIDRDEFREAVRLIRDDVRGVSDRLEALDARARAAEQKIAVLEDRSPSRAAALWGGGTSGAVIAALEVVKWYLRTP